MSGSFAKLKRGIGCRHTAVAVFVFLVSFAVQAADDKQDEKSPEAADRATVLVVTGAGGGEEFDQSFKNWAERWTNAAKKAEARLISIGPAADVESESSDKELLRDALIAEPKRGSGEFWIVLLGHGAFDRRSAKFNLRGADISAGELARLLVPFRRPVAVIAAFSSSGPYIARLAGGDRVIVSATKSGDEINYSRFGQFVSEAIGDTGADLDKDGQTSLLEAWLTASRKVEDWYKGEGRLATEHALLDDNGDGKGTPADWFRGIRAVKKAKDGTSRDGNRAHQFHLIRSEQEKRMSPELRARRDRLELEVIRHRETKARMSEDAYYAKLEELLLKLARLYAEES